MNSKEQESHSPEEPLKDWVSQKVKRRLATRMHEPFYSVDFPQMIIPPILKMVSNQSEAEAAIDILFSELHERTVETKLDCYHSHAIALETETYVCTDHAYSLAQDPEQFYMRLCERMDPRIETTGKVASKLFGPEIASRITSSLVAICLGDYYLPLQRKAIQIIKEQGIERFEKLCSETTRILKEGGHRAEVAQRTPDHHGMGWEVVNEYQYRPESLDAAEQYLKDQGILEQE